MLKHQIKAKKYYLYIYSHICTCLYIFTTCQNKQYNVQWLIAVLIGALMLASACSCLPQSIGTVFGTLLTKSLIDEF